MAVMRLDKLLSNMGVESRKGVREYLRAGAVTVDGVKVKDHGMKIDTEKNVVRFHGEEIVYKKYIYLMMNKPAGVISATDDPRQIEKTVVDLLPEDFLYYAPFPVGRLDKDTVGLLLLTNDGVMSHRMLSPKKHVEKEYFAKISGTVTQNDVLEFEKGITLDDGNLCKTAKLSVLKNEGGFCEVSVILTEGKFHQVKRMFEAVGKEVVFLKRVKFGGLDLDETLAEGEVRELTEEEMTVIKKYISED